MECKSGSQETPGVTGRFGLGIRNEAGQRLREFCQENALVIANTLFHQHKRRLYTWTSKDGRHRNQIDYILYSRRWRSPVQSAKTRLGADCGLDHELLIVKFRLKLKKVEKTTRPFRYDLNQIPYDYTVEVRNRFEPQSAPSLVFADFSIFGCKEYNQSDFSVDLVMSMCRVFSCVVGRGCLL